MSKLHTKIKSQWGESWVEHRSTHSQSGHWKMVCSEIHTLAAKLLWKNLGTHFQENVWAPKSFRWFWRRQQSLPSR